VIQTRVLSFAYVLVMALLLSYGLAYGVPASPDIHELIQPDGTIIYGIQWGDEWVHGWETVDDYTIVKDEVTGFWFYADRDYSGEIFPSNIRADSHPTSELQRFLRPSGKAAQITAAIKETAYQEAAPSTGTINIPVLLINFKDRNTTQTPGEFSSLLFEDKPEIATGPGSLKDYYKEIS